MDKARLRAISPTFTQLPSLSYASAPARRDRMLSQPIEPLDKNFRPTRGAIAPFAFLAMIAVRELRPVNCLDNPERFRAVGQIASFATRLGSFPTLAGRRLP
jgi:hypothetical protein